jgi:small subunit ribosomal protein S1
MSHPTPDHDRQKFRPTDQFDQEIDQELGELSLDDLYGAKPSPVAATASSEASKGVRRGRVSHIDPARDEVFVDLGGKSQGVASLSQSFPNEMPKVGDEVEFLVERFDAAEGLLILTRKGATATNVTWDNLEVGQIVEGTVTGVNKGGLELQVKQMRAFMPAGQVDLYFHKDISEFLNQRLTVEVTQFDRERKSLIVSRRNVLEREKADARARLMEEIAEGQTRRGTVRSIMDYGAFVDLGGLDGLLHVSELSHRRGVKVSDFLKEGDLVEVKILKFDRESGKLSLSLKATMPDPWTSAADKYPVGSQLTGRVSRVESFGAFIEVEEGIEGLLPVSEISWQRIGHPRDAVKEGDTLRLVVLTIDPAARKMSFSLKQAGVDPWKTAPEKYAVDMIVDGVVTRLVDFGAFVQIEPGLEGLVHVSEVADHRIKAAADVLKIGDKVKARVLELKPQERRMSLSIRRATEAAPTPSAPQAPTPTPAKKKRPELRGGLDFDFKKNK